MQNIDNLPIEKKETLENFIDSKALAKKISVAPSTIRTWAREGKIPSYKIAGLKGYLFLYSEVFKIITEKHVTTVH